MTAYVREHIQRTKARPLSARQACVLAYVRLQVAGGNSFPSAARIAAWGRETGGYSPYDIDGVLLALAVRGLLEATKQTRTRRGLKPDGWRITDAGWAA